MSKEANAFTYMSGDHGIGRRWITHDPDDHFAGEFKTEAEARAAVELWNQNSGRLVKMDWKAPPEGEDDSNRGTYIISIDGTNWKRRICCGWHSMEHAADVAMKLRNHIAKHGTAAAIDLLGALA